MNEQSKLELNNLREKFENSLKDRDELHNKIND